MTERILSMYMLYNNIDYMYCVPVSNDRNELRNIKKVVSTATINDNGIDR